MYKEEVAWENPDALPSQLVIAFCENDPYYPLPLMELDIDKELWQAFGTRYLEKAKEIHSEKDQRLSDLPRKFINGCMLGERENLARNLGHTGITRIVGLWSCTLLLLAQAWWTE